MNKFVRILALLAALSLFAAACGSDDDGGDTAATTTTTTAADSGDSGDDDGGEDATTTAAPDTGGEVATGVGVTDDEIRLGVITDLTGPFAGLTVPITDGLEGYWEWINDNGGVAGRKVVLDVQNAAYDLGAHGQFYDQMSDTGDEGSLMLQMSLGSPMTAATRDDLNADDMLAIPLSWNSSWSTENGKNILEWLTNYCVEAMNGIEYMASQGAENIAVVSRAGDYGEDGAIGAKKAIEDLGLTLAYDGQGLVVPGADPTPVATGIVDSGADMVWMTTGPSDLASVMGKALELGYTGRWAGNGPTYNQVLLGTPLAPALGATYTHFSPHPALDPDQSAGMKEVIDFMQTYRADAQYFSIYIQSYIMGEIARQTLEAAAAAGDLTRAGVVAAAQTLEVDLKGLAANINYGGDPNDFIPRESFVLSIDPDLYDAEATITTGSVGADGLVLIEGNYIGDVAQGFEYAPCFGI